GIAALPVTGGLFLGDDVGDLTATGTFPVSQDQRHTIQARASYQIAPAAWIAIAGAYGSGLPFEFTGDVDEALQLYGPRIVDRVDFETGRVDPSLTLMRRVLVGPQRRGQITRHGADVGDGQSQFAAVGLAELA